MAIDFAAASQAAFSATPVGGALSAVSGLASGGPSSAESGDATGGLTDFGDITTGGITRGLSLPDLSRLPREAYIVAGVVGVIIVALLLRKK